MRIVRFVHTDLFDFDTTPRWGMLIDQLVYPLGDAPYLSAELRRDGQYAPEVVGGPYLLEEIKLVEPVAPSKIICVGRNYAESRSSSSNRPVR
jgi:2-keto-4-pentenoate hydratase/2-oxohepta-3-ene-1,7-dioic acid hydratase in catechol pathway